MASSTIQSIGSLRELVRFERLKSTPDELGGLGSEKWTAIATDIPARITAVKGLEVQISQGLQAVATYQVWVRSSSQTTPVTEADRIVDQRSGKTFNIRFISNPDERGRFLQFIADLGVGS